MTCDVINSDNLSYSLDAHTMVATNTGAVTMYALPQ